MLPTGLLRRVEGALGCAIERADALGGGCISHATRLETDLGRFFLKWVDQAAAATLEAEAHGLAALGSAKADLIVPQVVFLEVDRPGEEGILVLEWVEQGSPDTPFWDRFGTALAGMHRCQATSYGFGSDNFIGRLPQQNAWTGSWPDFFRDERLSLQAGLARQHGRWKARWEKPFDRLLIALDEILPHDPPASVLHGDLWSGNFLASTAGMAALFDPAAYYGERETDLAMTELFGGYDRTFYRAYQEAWPLHPGYEERRDVYNLYHLINHLNHFGDAYASQVEHVLSTFR